MRAEVRDPSRKVNQLNKVVRNKKSITEFTRSISSTKIVQLVLMTNVKVSKEELVDGLIDRTSSNLDITTSKFVHKEEDGDQYRKKKYDTTVNEVVTQVENIK